MQTARKIKYQYIADELKERIMSGQVCEGGLLPSQKQLISDYGIALGTARQIINKLISEGWALAIHGKGTYAKIPRPPLATDNNATSNLIGYAMLGIVSEYDPLEQMVIRGMMPVIQNANKNLIFASFPPGSNSTEDFIAFLNKLSGIVISEYIEKPFLDILKAKGTRAVIVGGGYASDLKDEVEEFHNVQADAVHAGYLAGQSLAMYGHQNVFLFCQLDTDYGVKIKEGFQKACNDYNLANQCELQRVKTEKEMAVSLSTLPDVTGIACLGDMHSCRLIQNLKLLGIDVPEQKSVISIGGLPRNILGEANLSRININIPEIGREVANLILSETKSAVHKKIPAYFEKGDTIARVASLQQRLNVLEKV